MGRIGDGLPSLRFVVGASSAASVSAMAGMGAEMTVQYGVLGGSFKLTDDLSSYGFELSAGSPAINAEVGGTLTSTYSMRHRRWNSGLSRQEF